MTDDLTKTTPEEMRAPQGARVMEIVWADGTTTATHHRLLRGFCPCAHCQGHQGPIVWVNGTDDLPASALEILEIAEVGQYAVQFSWGDGHGAGIYSFRYLRELSEIPEEDDEGLKARRFGR